MHFTVPLFERRVAGLLDCITLGLGRHTARGTGRNAHKVRTGLADKLRPVFAKVPPRERARLRMARGVRVERVRLQLALVQGGERRKVSGVYPIVVEPRWSTADDRVLVAYHPLRQDDAVVVRADLPLEEQLRPHLARAWAKLDDEELASLPCRGRERVDVISFSGEARSLLEELPAEGGRLDDDEEQRGGRRRRRALKVLLELGEHLGEEAASGDLELGVPRSPYRERLQLLLGAGKSRPAVVVGPPGSGKTTLIHRAVADLLEIDGYAAHRNLDRVRPVFRVSGRRLIAGMSRLGEWEKRCLDVLAEARDRQVILVVDDLAQFGTIGRSRESDRSLADFFRGPLARRELLMIGECTEEQLRRLEQEAPTFAALFAPLHLPPTTPQDTLRLLIREVRELERRHRVHLGPHALRAILDLGGSLLSARSLPGNAMDLLRELARAHEVGPKEEPREVGSREVLSLLSAKTGVPELLLRGKEPLDPAAVRAALGGQVMGQDEAVRVASDLVCRVKAGLVDPRRPYGVYLFTGPTGTGKTELAKCLAEYLYGDAARMLRFDMSELSGPDAPARLIGDRWRPEGLLTQRVIEQPFSLVLLDEIEKAHPSVLSLLLQLFEDGRLTDASGRTAHFQHAVVVMTSNLGARPRAAVGFGDSPEAILHDVARAVREFFPPELWNRIDRVVPFRPLTEAIAAQVAQKELDKLRRRRGLAERSIFVDVGAGVAARVAREAFASRDGARSVKRFIEDRLGSPLAAAITTGAPAAMQVLHVEAVPEGFSVTREALVEAEPARCRFALEPLLDAPIAALKARLPELAAFVASLQEGGHLAHISERLRHHLAQQGDREHAEAVYNLDSMRAAVAAFHARIEALAQADAPDDHELVEMQRFGRLTISEPWTRDQHIRLFMRSQMPARPRPASKASMLACLAEGAWLRRALAKVDDPTQHAVFVDVSRAADLSDRARFAAESAGLDEMLTSIYEHEIGRGQHEASAGVRNGRRVLKLVGLCVRDFFELEDGMHVWTSLGGGPEVVRVRVTPALPGEAVADVLARPITGPMAPVVRKVRFDPPREAGPPTPHEIEDYVTGYAATPFARSLGEALAPLWLLRESREDA